MQSFEQRVTQIGEDREHGSRWLVRETILLLHALGQQLLQSSLTNQEQAQYLRDTARKLIQLRPAMAALSSAVSQVVAPQSTPQSVVQEAQKLLDTLADSPELIARIAQPFLHGRLLTCSISDTVLAVLQTLHDQIEHVVVTEGRPRYEGRETARQLQQFGLSVTLITDAQAAIFLPLCDAVVVGADSILIGGELLNKAGTAQLAWTAQGYHVPFYVLCESLKISGHHWSPPTPTLLAQSFPLLEEKESSEVLENPIPGVRVRNFYFDCTPYSLLTKIFTEQGSLDFSTIQSIGQIHLHNLQQLT